MVMQFTRLKVFKFFWFNVESIYFVVLRFNNKGDLVGLPCYYKKGAKQMSGQVY